MKKIVFLGDSITDMNRKRGEDREPYGLGNGYVFFIDGELSTKFPQEYKVYNRGIAGNNILDITTRVKVDVWKLEPDILTIFTGINDADCIEFTKNPNGVELDRYERSYRNLIEDTIKYCGKIPMVLVKPFILTTPDRKNELFTKFYNVVLEYSKVVQKLADEFGFSTIDMQPIFNEWEEKYSMEQVLYDGTHPSVAGSKLIADEWLKIFYSKLK